MKNKIILIFCVLICINGFQALRADNSLHVRFHLKAGYNFISTITPGSDLIASYNDRLEAIKNVGFFTVSDLENLTESSHMPSFGGEFELFLNPRLSLSLGADFYVSSKSGYFDVFFTADGGLYTYYRKYVLKSQVLPIRSAVRYHFPFRRFSAYLEGGLGFYFENMKSLTTYEDNWEQGEIILWEARGQALIPFLGAGFRFAFTRYTSFSLEIDFPLSRIQSFKLHDCYESWRNGEALTFFDENGTTVEYNHDFLGLNIPALSIQSSSIFLKESHNYLLKSIDIIEICLSLRMIPILYGDIILDSTGNFSIISGDQIISELCSNLQKYQVEKVIFATKKQGISGFRLEKIPWD